VSTPTRAFVGRLTELSVFDPLGDQVGRVRDVVVTFNVARTRPRVIGLVVEVAGRERVFVPMTRVTSVEGGQVITTGLVNMRRFEQRGNETLVVAELFERPVEVRTEEGGLLAATVEDIGIEQHGSRGWSVARAFVRTGAPRGGLGRLARRRGETRLVAIEDVVGLRTSSSAQSAARLVEAYEDLKPADLAEVIHDLTPKRRAEVAAASATSGSPTSSRSCPRTTRSRSSPGCEVDRAADVLEAMEPDDAADLLAELPKERQEELLQKMDPTRPPTCAACSPTTRTPPVGLMTTEPVILGPEASIAEALAVVRRESCPRPWPARSSSAARRWRPPPAATSAWSTSSACCASPRTPDRRHPRQGRRAAHSPTPPSARSPGMLATYDLVGLPVVDAEGHLLGAVTVDDVLDHILPEDWREDRHDVQDTPRGLVAERERRAASTSPARGSAAGPAVVLTEEAFGVVSEKFARFMGTPYFLIGMTVFVGRSGCSGTRGAREPALRPVPLHLPHADPQPAGLVRRAADPPRAEPAGRPRPGRPGAGPQPGRAQPRRHRVPHPRGRRPAARVAGPGHPRLRARRAARPARRAGGTRAGAHRARTRAAYDASAPGRGGRTGSPT
jgi:CBS domain-containing protein/sporulation protein YlmC with PRC-barrel domain